MRLYVELGRRAAALRQYQLCVGVLKRKLGRGARGRNQEELAISREHGFPLFAAGGLWFTAYALVVQGEREQGFELMDEGARAYEAAGALVLADFPRHCAGGELLIEAGRLEAAVEVTRDAPRSTR